MNKKIMVPLFATVLGLSVVGSIGGAVAWYQFNSRVTTSFVGVSAADSGVLQISTDGQKWGRDVYETGSQNGNRLTPCTFGYAGTAGKSSALPGDAHCRPEAGVKEMGKWSDARKGYEYLQYDIYLKAQKTSGSSTVQSSEKVYLSEMFLDSLVSGKPEIARALRVHLAVYDDPSNENLVKRNFLISREGLDVNLYGNLDLDNNGELDRVHGWAWDTTDKVNVENALSNNPLIEYGVGNGVQKSWAITTSQSLDDLESGDATDNNFILAPRATADTEDHKKGDLYHTIDEGDDANLICKTLTNRAVKITVTVWLEGWSLLKGTQKYEVAGTQPADAEAFAAGEYYLPNGNNGYDLATAFDDQATYYVKSANNESAIWDVSQTGEVGIKVGMQFDVGKNAFKPADPNN